MRAGRISELDQLSSPFERSILLEVTQRQQDSRVHRQTVLSESYDCLTGAYIMTSQFFKDAHGANNRFVPRAFSLNLGGSSSNATTGNSSNSHGHTNGDESSEMHTLPHATSTAPSTAASSHFFTAMGGKIHPGLSKDVSIDEDSSLVESIFKVDSRASGSRRCVEEVPDDDIEITDVREVTIPGANTTTELEQQSSGQQTSIDVHPSDSSSGDLLLEAFYKSQKLCNGLKNSLERAKSKIQTQAEELESQKNSISKMKDTFRKFKENLNALESGSRELKESRQYDNQIVKQVKVEYSEVLKNIDLFKQEVANYRKKIDHLKQIKLSSTYEVEKSMLHRESPGV
jgi:hypothetical protein